MTWKIEHNVHSLMNTTDTNTFSIYFKFIFLKNQIDKDYDQIYLSRDSMLLKNEEN